jgi:hypothetical protein
MSRTAGITTGKSTPAASSLADSPTGSVREIAERAGVDTSTDGVTRMGKPRICGAFL